MLRLEERESGSVCRSRRCDGMRFEKGGCWVAVSFWSSMGVYPGVFVKSVEVVLNEEIAKTVKNKSVEVADSGGLAGGRVAERVRRGDFHIS
jgi:hypothetical protein